MAWTGSDADGSLTTSSTLIVRTFIVSDGIEEESGVKTPVCTSRGIPGQEGLGHRHVGRGGELGGG